MTFEERQRKLVWLKQQELRLMAEESLSEYTRQAWHVVEPKSAYVHGWHIDAMCEHLEAVSRGQIRNLVINVPPRHMKSLEVSVFWPSWEWGPRGRPETRWLYASYAEALSLRDSVKCRQVIQSPWYQENWGDRFSLLSDQNEKGKYVNDKSGHRIATSVDGRGTGEGGDRIVIDDPHKVMEVESDTQRKRVIDWWDTEMTSRGNDPKTVAKVIVMQRVHEGDLSGHVLEQGDWEHLCLPAEYELPTKKYFTLTGWKDPRRKEGELLWPERFGQPELKQLKKMGSRAAAGQLQQRPAPADGDIVKRAWFKFYRMLPEDIDFWALSCDLTFKETDNGAYNTFGVWARKGADKYLVEQPRERMGFTKQLKKIAELREKYPQLNAIYIEDAANAQAAKDVLQAKIPGLILVPAGGSKLVRAEAASPQFESHNVYLPDPDSLPRDSDEDEETWVDKFINEWIKVPNNKYWDQVDQSAMALLKLDRKKVIDITPVSITAPSVWRY
jgi:predicted phage terminase large subunit-like protein